MSGEGTACLSFDNLGEAAEVGAGARDPDAPLGGHPTATEALPRILELLAARELPATFFLEGLNAELYPDLLRRIEAEGHEVAYHSWTHEQWGGLSLPEQAENLARGLDAFAKLGLEPRGFRPPGGELGPGRTEILRQAGLRYVSPAANLPPTGRSDRSDQTNRPVDIGLVPFEWRHVDASCVIPDMEGPLRGADEFHEFLGEEIETLGRGEPLTIVLHPFMLEWHGEERLSATLDRLVAARARGCAMLRCDEAAELLSEP